MKRRLFLGLAGAAWVSSSTGRWFTASRLTRIGAPAARRRPALNGLAPTRTVGEAYLWARREPLSEEELCKRFADAGGPAPSADYYTRLRSRVESDFATQRIVNVGGWFLSETEAAVSALVAMS